MGASVALGYAISLDQFRFQPLPLLLTSCSSRIHALVMQQSPSPSRSPVTGYLVERCSGVSCTSFSQIATPAGTTYTDSGLTASSSYEYRVRAQDATTIGPYSNSATASPADTQAPTVPTGLKSTGVTTASIALAWTASTDLPTSGGTGVAGYFVYRDGNTATAIATVQGGT